MSYHFSKELRLPFDEVIIMVTSRLKKEGFGVLTEVNVRETLREKLNVDFRNYRILGACNPPFAYRALQLDDRIGLMMPCNVIVQERDEGVVEVSAVDPVASMQAIDNPELREVAEEIRQKLRAVIDGL